MTKTTNYQLPKWEKTDRIQMKDFNDMTATLDAALKANADAIAAETTARVAGDMLVKLKEITVTSEIAQIDMDLFRHRPAQFLQADYPPSARLHRQRGLSSALRQRRGNHFPPLRQPRVCQL